MSTGMEQITGIFDYARRTSFNRHNVEEAEVIEGLHIKWNAEVYSVDGAWYHCWIPRVVKRNSKKMKKLKQEFRAAARRMGDPVRYSWDWEPDQRGKKSNASNTK